MLRVFHRPWVLILETGRKDRKESCVVGVDGVDGVDGDGANGTTQVL
jgi:hypothetical protein